MTAFLIVFMVVVGAFIVLDRLLAFASWVWDRRVHRVADQLHEPWTPLHTRDSYTPQARPVGRLPWSGRRG